MANRWGNNGNSDRFIFLGSKIIADDDCTHEIKRCLLLERKVYDQSRQHIKKQRHYFANKGPSSQSYGFPSSHVWMWELGHKEGWASKNWCFQTVVLEKTWDSLEQQKDQTSQSWRKSTLNIYWRAWCWSWNSNTLATWCKEPIHWKRPWCWDRLKVGEGDEEGEMIEWHHWLNGHEFEQTLGDDDGQGSLACCSSWGHKESDMTERLNNKTVFNKKSQIFIVLALYVIWGILLSDNWG